ncbi:MAG: DNA helicase UvrD [Acidobacteriota bacterium]
MDKRVILAVAGSGKTTRIIESLHPEKRSLIVTYTVNNARNLRDGIIEAFGHVPPNVTLRSYFPFLYSMCFKPFLWRKTRARGITWDRPPPPGRFKQSEQRYYMNTQRRMYHNRIAKLLERQMVIDPLCRRLEKYYDELLVDEVQDIGGHDFNLLMHLATCRMDIQLVGDFFQHTFDTSRDGAVNKGLHTDFDRYRARFQEAGLAEDRTTLCKSYRCSPTVCAYVSDHLGVDMQSHREASTAIQWVETREEAQRLYECTETIKLFLKEHYKYGCTSRNWGASKGDSYDDVAIVLSKESCRRLKNGTARALKPATRNKLYVALTRAKRDVYLLPVELVRACMESDS